MYVFIRLYWPTAGVDEKVDIKKLIEDSDTCYNVDVHEYSHMLLSRWGFIEDQAV